MTDRIIGEYSIVRFLGKGGMSEVYEAEHVRLKSRHAIKFFSYEGDVDGVKERFQMESRLLARLSHPRVVHVADSGVDPDTGKPYFVMDLVVDSDGNVRSLADVPAGGADESQIAMWYDDLREGLAYIHGKGIIHRDLKLENVLIGPDRHAVLTDFGISKVEAYGNGDVVADPVQTIIMIRDGKTPLMGTEGYMAPELIHGGSASPESDYYALGVIVYRLLTGMWCDSRTDIAGVLDTYDPVWRKILPKLMHMHAQGRECPSWRELKDAETERRMVEAEGDRIRAKRFVRVAVAACVLALLCGAFLLYRVMNPIIKERPVVVEKPVFDERPALEDVLFVPKDAPEEEVEGKDGKIGRVSRAQMEAAMRDAWVLFYDAFAQLRKGLIAREKVIDDLKSAAKLANDEDDNLFSNYPDHPESGEYKALAELLEASAKRLEGRKESH